MFRTALARTSALRAAPLRSTIPASSRFVSSTPHPQKGPVDVLKDAAKKVDRTVSDVAVKGIETGEKVVGAVKDKVPESTGEAKGQAKEAYGEAKGKANEVAGEAQQEYGAAKGKASELAGEAKGKAKEVKGEAKAKM